MTYEKGLFAQADPGIVSGSTNERKKMSTKTIYKRIALVAVATLGAGVLSVAPASAASSNGVAGTPTQATTVGTATTSTVGSTIANTDTNPGTLSLTVPAGSSVTMADRDGSFSNGTVAVLTSAVAGFTFNSTTGAVAITATPTSFEGTVTITPDVPGLYTATFTAASGTVGIARMQAAGIAGTVGTSGLGTTSVGAVAGGVAAFTFTTPAAQANGAVYRFVSSGVGAITAATGVAADGTTGNNPTEASGVAGNWGSGATWTRSNASAGTATITVSSAVAGAQTVTINSISATTGAPTAAGTITITWGASPVVTAGTTTSVVNSGTGTTATGADATVVVSRLATGQQANIVVTVRDGAGAALNGQTVSATIAGSGLIKAYTGNAGGVGDARATSVTLAAGVNVASIGVNADGTAGVGTITILVGTTTVATETVTFFGAPATITAVQNHKVLSSAGGAIGSNVANPTGADIANTPSVILTVLDANGTRIPGLTASAASITAVSSDPTVVSESINLQANDGTGAANTVTRTYNIQVSSVAKASGSTATLKFRVVVSAALGTFIESAPLTYTLGGSVASVALSLNKASYTPGEAATATLTVKDAAGNAAFDGDHANITSAALSSSLGITGSLVFGANGTTVSTLGGVAAAKINAPATSGTWTISGTSGTGPITAAEKNKALTASATVAAPANAEISALTTLVNSLIAKINALNKLVVKIQKKVRA
jgi:trimeric autotransporter adhesin